MLVFDEMSMVDQLVFGRVAELILTSGLDGDITIVLLGDTNQLASIGPGDVLRQVCRANGTVPHTELTEVVRQGGRTGLLDALDCILAGELPPFTEGPRANDEILAEGLTWIPTTTDDVEAIQAFLRREAQSWPETWFMAATHQAIRRYTPCLRDVLNTTTPNPGAPDDTSGDDDDPGQNVFRAGDRVLFRKNWHDQDLFNGDMGTLVEVGCCADDDVKDVDDTRMVARIAFDDRDDNEPVTVEYDRHECPFQMAYMTTVHAAQGSEAERVVVVIDQAAGPFVTRNLLYTAASRAKKHCLLLAPLHVIAEAVQRSPPSRLTHLADNLTSARK